MSTPPKSTFHHGTHGAVGADSAARQADATYDRHRVRIVDTIRRLGGLAWVVVGGAGETARRVVADLPTDMSRRTRLAPDLRVDTNISVIRQIVSALDRDIGGMVETDLVNESLSRARSTPCAILGAGPMRVALGQRAIRSLLISVHQLDEAPDEIETAVRAAIAQGAEVRFIRGTAATLLDSAAAGIATELRFPVAQILPTSTQMA